MTASPGSSIDAQAGTNRDVSGVRDAARWLLGAFAAVFAVLVAGLQFSALGGVGGAERAIAIGASAVALALTVAVITRAGWLLADPGLSLDDLLGREVKARMRLLNEQAKSASEFRTVSSVDPILAQVIGHRALLHHSDPTPSKLRDALQNARRAAPEAADAIEKLAAAAADVKQAVQIANDYYFSTRFRSLTRFAAWSAGLGAACVIAFALATAQADGGDPLVQEAVPATLYLRPGMTGANLGMGATCKVDSLPVTIVGGKLSEPVVVSNATATCGAAEFLVDADIGVVVPSSPSVAPRT